MSDGKKMAFTPKVVASDHGDSEEDLARADTYGLLAEWFAHAPTDDFFNRLATSPAIPVADQSDLANAWRALMDAVSRANPGEAGDEFDALFVAVGKPAVALHASVYMGGSMNQTVLVELRSDLAVMGLETNADNGETEDHFATLCEIMRYIIAAPDAKGSTLVEQQRFFASYFQPWAEAMFESVQEQPQAKVYAAVAGFAKSFFAIERLSFDIYSASVDAAQTR
jgi:TorA maturation chaperone TorD